MKIIKRNGAEMDFDSKKIAIAISKANLAAEESERKGKKVSRQAISNRWDRILAKLCKGFNVPKPVRRNNNKDED